MRLNTGVPVPLMPVATGSSDCVRGVNEGAQAHDEECVVVATRARSAEI